MPENGSIKKKKIVRYCSKSENKMVRIDVSEIKK